MKKTGMLLVQAATGAVVVLAVALFFYGTYRVAKTVSYSMFYESMVEDTIRSLVKEEALK